MKHRLGPNYRVAGTFPGQASAAQLLAETRFYAADEGFARAHGGPITIGILDAIPNWYRNEAYEAGLQLNIDLRVHELQRGWYPASPGWHCDSPMRETKFDGTAPTIAVRNNLVGCVSTHPEGISNTLFLDEPVEFESAHTEVDAGLWADLGAAIEARPRTVYRTRDGNLTLFDCYSPHNVEAARRDGVRLFIRISMWEPPTGHRPGLSSTEQVYATVTETGTPA